MFLTRRGNEIYKIKNKIKKKQRTGISSNNNTIIRIRKTIN